MKASLNGQADIYKHRWRRYGVLFRLLQSRRSI